jgi:UDP-N-acetylmuramyl pentapeptide synthase
MQVVRYAVNADADVTARDAEFSLSGMMFKLSTAEGEARFQVAVGGSSSHLQHACAVASGLALGYSLTP